MKVFISGPITNTEDYMQRFEAAENWLAAQGHTPLNPAKVNATIPFLMRWDKYMDITLVLLRECEAIYMLEGWEFSTGARVERNFAAQLGMKIMHEKDIFEQLEDEEDE